MFDTSTCEVLHIHMLYYCMQILMYIARLCIPIYRSPLASQLIAYTLKNVAETRHWNTHTILHKLQLTQTTSCVNIEWECTQPLRFYLPIWNGNIAWKPAKCAKFSAAHIAFIIHNEHCINALSFISTTTQSCVWSIFCLAFVCWKMLLLLCQWHTIVDIYVIYIHIRHWQWQQQQQHPMVKTMTMIITTTIIIIAAAIENLLSLAALMC